MHKMLLAEMSLGLMQSVEVKLLITTILVSMHIHSKVTGS